MNGLPGAVPFRAAIFDLDGTLVDSEPAWEKAKRIVSARYGVAPTQAQIDATVGRSLDVFLADVFGVTEPDPMLALRNEIFDEADLHLPAMRSAVPGATDFLRRLSKAGLRIAICSSSGRRHIEAAVDMLGIGDEVELMVSAAELARGKPDPLPYQVSLERLGLGPAEALAFEDAVPGAQSAKGAGLFVAAVGPGCTGPGFGFCDLQAETYGDLRGMMIGI